MSLLKLQRELYSIMLSLTCFGFANGLLGVFIPLLLLRAGAPLWQVAAFYVAYAVIKLFINFPIARYLIMAKGVHAAFAVGFSASILQFLSLHLFVTTQHKWWILASAASLALANSCMWMSEHLHVSALVQSATRSSNMATIETIKQVLSVVAPLVGGFIGAALGPSWLIGTALVFLFAAFLPLRHMGRLHQAHTRDQSKEPLRYSIAAAPRRDVFANFCWVAESTVGTLVWPMFLAVELAAYKSIGIITAAGGIGTLIVIWFAGRRGDRGGDRRVLREAATASSTINLLRLVSTATGWITLVSVAYRSSLAYNQVAWVSIYYGHARRRGPQWIMAMEIACDVSCVCLWTLLLAVAYFSNTHAVFTTAFLLASAAAWGCLAVSHLSNAAAKPPSSRSVSVGG